MFWGKSADETSLKGFLALGFAFALGMAPALLLRFTGIEDYVTQKVEAEVGWSVDPHIATASDFLQKGNLDAAINEVNAQIAEKPSSTEARELLVNLYSRKGEIGLKYCQALEGVCEVHLQAANPEAAWMHYENYLKAGGRKMPAATWFQLARFAENHGDSQRALSEYEEFAKAWPNERSAVLALMSAGRIQFQSGRWEEATQLYTAAQTSSVPHREWDDLIRKGLQKVGDVAKPAVETISSGLRQPGSG